MELEVEVKKLVAHIKSCGLQIPLRNPPHEHVGSIIADAVLQAGHRWKTHVGPRLERLRNIYPKADTISGLSDLLKNKGAQELLDWHGEDELERFSMTVRFFGNEQVETFDNLRDWLESDNNRDRLITKNSRSDKAGIPRIADATADYYRVLVGLPDAVKVDTLVQKFLVDAGIVKKHTYEEKRSIVQLAAKELGKRPIDLDGAIWNYEEKKGKEKDEMEQDERLMVPLPKDKIKQLNSIAKEFGMDMDGATLAKYWIIQHLLGFEDERSSLQTCSTVVGNPTSGEIIVSGKVIPHGKNGSSREIARINKNDSQRITGKGGPLDVSIAQKKFGAKWSGSGTVLVIPIKLQINKVTYDANLRHRKKTEKVWIGSPLNNNKVKLAAPLAVGGFNAGDNVKLKVRGNRIQVEK